MPVSSLEAQRPAAGSRRFCSLAKELVLVVVGALVVSVVLRAFVGQMFLIPSKSMESTLLKGDRVLVEEVTGFHRGDVVVFEDPGGWLEGHPVAEPGRFDHVLQVVGVRTASTPRHLIKRVIGMPGDRVVCCDEQDRLTVNGQALDESGYLHVGRDGTQVAPSEVRFTVVVPAARIFVMGDHRDASQDSRCHLSDARPGLPPGEIAFVPERLVVGPAVAVVAPFERVHRLRTPSAFADVPGPSGPAPAHASIEPAGVSC